MILAFSLCVGMATSASAQTIDIVMIFQNFVASRVAADRCQALDATLEPRFQSNLMAVTIRATERQKQNNPGYSDRQLADSMSAMANGVRQAVAAAIDRDGCGNAGVQRLIQMYRMHGTMTLG